MLQNREQAPTCGSNEEEKKNRKPEAPTEVSEKARSELVIIFCE
jgi:hypothetical protein